MEGQLLCPRLGWGLEAGLEGETEHGDFFAQVLLWCGLWYGTCLAYPRLPQVEHPGLLQHLQEQTPAGGHRALSSGDSQRTHLWSGSPIIYSAFISLLN